MDNREKIITKNSWAENIKKYDLFWPDENIIRFLNKSYNKSNRDKIKVLDLGCGSGRNSIAIASEGFKTYSIDYNKECIDITKEKATNLDLNLELSQNEGNEIPFDDNSFDCVIAWGSLFYNDSNGRIELLNEINRVLKKEGTFLANWRTTEDYFYKKGKEIEKNTFFLDESCKKFGLQDIVYYFAEQNDLKKLYNKTGFHIYNFDKKDFYTSNLEVKNSHWHVWAIKE
ncbi:class I SAM-dependent methyltransferase [Clostridium botulinum]|uniref:Putative methyltransferase n=1 Tax=Clostridium botulinum CFSAN001627 TaxID=1232189 RepID=M1ZXR8_CLOBO|nr:class I SAM-dependent methyltransferase [Clostridium botulinum]EKN42108.1 putative methyltransferase [Clostridium botulinum CFSAN001627]APC84216.1 methyltransferase small domain protein [Clostridium botulinum]AXG97621.1 class I SAM-dependent methyltransferase [Clostridium botulinum]EDT80209.1 S-adenosylmethionine-dependent methyltransferase [Clostridium botulinum NCTC 2916]MBY6771215.1 class I SAM-dependent methyltransferase [Clostridium botulinum]